MIDPVVPNAFPKAGLLSMMVCSEDGSPRNCTGVAVTLLDVAMNFISV